VGVPSPVTAAARTIVGLVGDSSRWRLCPGGEDGEGAEMLHPATDIFQHARCQLEPRRLTFQHRCVLLPRQLLPEVQGPRVALLVLCPAVINAQVATPVVELLGRVGNRERHLVPWSEMEHLVHLDQPSSDGARRAVASAARQLLHTLPCVLV